MGVFLGGERDAPRFVSMSATSSRVTRPSLSRSRIWNPSRISRTREAGIWDRASRLGFPCPPPVIPPIMGGRSGVAALLL